MSQRLLLNPSMPVSLSLWTSQAITDLPVKRRFVRQNREIARINSIQSLRIRSLESEVSSLLSENVTLREEIVSLGQEVQRLESAKALQDGVYDIKAKLDAKLAELNGLVTDLGGLPRKVHKPSYAQTTSANVGLSASIPPRREVNAGSLAGADNGRLPAILEDKYYPRETLE